MSDNLNSHNNFMDFEELSKAFINKPKDFQQILKMINEDFIGYHMQIMDALSEKSLENFKKIRHNIRGNIILFKIPGFPELLEKIERYLEGQDEDMTGVREEVHQKFNLIFQTLENKISELSDLGN